MNETNWIDIPVALSSFDRIREAVFRIAGDTPESRKALLACDEVLTNIVSYSGAGRLAFSSCRQDDMLCISFSDDGMAFDPTAVPLTRKEFELLDSGGMGISLVRQCAAGIQYSFRDGRNILSLQFPVKESHGL